MVSRFRWRWVGEKLATLNFFIKKKNGKNNLQLVCHFYPISTVFFHSIIRKKEKKTQTLSVWGKTKNVVSFRYMKLGLANYSLKKNLKSCMFIFPFFSFEMDSSRIREFFVQYFSKWGPQISIIIITWEPVRDAKSRAPTPDLLN